MPDTIADSLNPTDRKLFFRLFFFGVFFVLLVSLTRLFLPFFTPVMFAATLTIVFYPLHLWITKRVNNRNAAAFVSTLLIAMIVVLPVLFLVWYLVKEAADLFPTAKSWLESAKHMSDTPFATTLPAPLNSLWLRVESVTSTWQVDLQGIILNNLNRVGTGITAFGAKVAKNIVFIAFDVVVMTFTLFFFLRDGVRTVQWIVDIIPMERENKNFIIDVLNRTISAVVRGLFITAMTQAALAGLAFWVLGVRFPVLLTFATAFMALIPFAGAAGIWLPVSLYMLFKVSVTKGIILLVWGGLVVSMVDNFLRPILISDKAKLPILLLFLGILGGLQTYGFIGLLVGPLMIATVLAFVKIYQTQYHRAHPDKPADLQSPHIETRRTDPLP